MRENRLLPEAPVVKKEDGSHKMPKDDFAQKDWPYCKGIFHLGDCAYSTEGGNMVAEELGRCSFCMATYNKECVKKRRANAADKLIGAMKSISIDPSPAAKRATKRDNTLKEKREKERLRKWGHSKIGKRKTTPSAVLEANKAAREARSEKRAQERPAAEAAAAAAGTPAAANDDDDMQPLVANDDDDDAAGAGPGQAAPVSPTMTLLEQVREMLEKDNVLELEPSQPADDDDDPKPRKESNAPGKQPADDDDDAEPRRKKSSLAARQRKRLRHLENLRRQQDSSEHGEGSSKHGEGSSKRHKATPSKQGEGSSKRDKAPQTPPQSNPYADDEADEEEEDRRSPDAHLIGSGRKPRGRITASEAGSATAKARIVGGEIERHGVFQYNFATGQIRSRSPSPQTTRQKALATQKRKQQEHEERMRKRQRSPPSREY